MPRKKSEPSGRRLIGVSEIRRYLKESHAITISRCQFWTIRTREGPGRFPAVLGTGVYGHRVYAFSDEVDLWVKLYAFRPAEDVAET